MSLSDFLQVVITIGVYLLGYFVGRVSGKIAVLSALKMPDFIDEKDLHNG